MLDDDISIRQSVYIQMRTLWKALALWAVTAAPLAAETRLLMGVEDGCMWCAKWEAQIGPIYPKTTEGEMAPLWQVDINDPLPSDVILNRPMIFTPTFVVLEDGFEVGRIEGYPGEDFFWGLLGQILGLPPAQT
jgi:hypothetical protein